MMQLWACCWWLTSNKGTREVGNTEITAANDAACNRMPHYHEFALIQHSRFISLSIALPAPRDALTSISSSLHTTPIFTFFLTVLALICKTAHLARYKEWWEEMSHSSAGSGPSHRNVNWPAGVGMERRRDEWAGGVEDDRSGPVPLCVFLKTWRFFDDYSNPTKDLSARNWVPYLPSAVFLSLKHNHRPPTLINLRLPLWKRVGGGGLCVGEMQITVGLSAGPSVHDTANRNAVSNHSKCKKKKKSHLKIIGFGNFFFF